MFGFGRKKQNDETLTPTRPRSVVADVPAPYRDQAAHKWVITLVDGRQVLVDAIVSEELDDGSKAVSLQDRWEAIRGEDYIGQEWAELVHGYQAVLADPGNPISRVHILISDALAARPIMRAINFHLNGETGQLDWNWNVDVD